MTLVFGLSLECLIYQVNAQSCMMLTNVAFFIFSSITPCASHIALITNQNWSRSSFPNSLNTGNFTVLAMLNHGGGGGGMGEDGGDGGEVGGSVGGGGMCRILYLIKWITLHRESFTSSSSFPHVGEIEWIFSGSLFPLFL